MGVDGSAFCNVRRATRAELDQLWPLLDRYYTEWDIWHRDTREQALADLERVAPFGFIVAERGATLAGCVLLRPLAIPKAAECKRLFVAPEFRGHGLASELMDYAESLAAAQGVTHIYLDSKPEFAAALALYRRRGYEACERYNDNAQATFFFRKHLRSSLDG